ncbi:probable plastid-lipid-associated protein 11 isoform X1 [Tanacetum coccineum]
MNRDQVTTNSLLSGTWRLLWTTEKSSLVLRLLRSKRLYYRFTSAVLRGKDWEFPLPPFGKGWFDSVYLDNDIRIAKDIRGDYLVVDRAPYQWKE